MARRPLHPSPNHEPTGPPGSGHQRQATHRVPDRFPRLAGARAKSELERQFPPSGPGPLRTDHARPSRNSDLPSQAPPGPPQESNRRRGARQCRPNQTQPPTVPERLRRRERRSRAHPAEPETGQPSRLENELVGDRNIRIERQQNRAVLGQGEVDRSPSLGFIESVTGQGDPEVRSRVPFGMLGRPDPGRPRS